GDPVGIDRAGIGDRPPLGVAPRATRPGTTGAALTAARERGTRATAAAATTGAAPGVPLTRTTAAGTIARTTAAGTAARRAAGTTAEAVATAAGATAPTGTTAEAVAAAAGATAPTGTTAEAIAAAGITATGAAAGATAGTTTRAAARATTGTTARAVIAAAVTAATGRARDHPARTGGRGSAAALIAISIAARAKLEATRLVAAGTMRSAWGAGARLPTTTATSTTAAATVAAAPAIAPAAAIVPRLGAGLQVHEVIEVALLLGSGWRILAAHHAHETHVVGAIADHLQRLHHARQTISRETELRFDFSSRQGGSRIRCGRLVLRRRFACRRFARRRFACRRFARRRFACAGFGRGSGRGLGIGSGRRRLGLRGFRGRFCRRRADLGSGGRLSALARRGLELLFGSGGRLVDRHRLAGARRIARRCGGEHLGVGEGRLAGRFGRRRRLGRLRPRVRGGGLGRRLDRGRRGLRTVRTPHLRCFAEQNPRELGNRFHRSFGRRCGALSGAAAARSLLLGLRRLELLVVLGGGAGKSIVVQILVAAVAGELLAVGLGHLDHLLHDPLGLRAAPLRAGLAGRRVRLGRDGAFPFVASADHAGG